MEAFRQFEADTPRHVDLLHYLIFVGGPSLREALNQFIKDCISLDLMSQFSWLGKNFGNAVAAHPLYNTKIVNLFFEAACSCKNFPKPNRANFIVHMKGVIRAAKQRGRTGRLRSKNPPGPRRRLHAQLEELFPNDENNETDQR